MIVTIFSFWCQVIEKVVQRECQEVLTNEMAKIKVEFKCYEELTNKERCDKVNFDW